MHVAHQAAAGTVSGKAGGRHARQPQHMAAAVQLADEAAYVVRRIVVCGAGGCGLLNFHVGTAAAIYAADEAAVGIISVSGEGNRFSAYIEGLTGQRICLVSAHQAAQAIALGGGDGDGLLPLQEEVPSGVFHIAVQTAYVSVAVGQVHVYAGVAGAAVIVDPGFGVGIAADEAAGRGAAGNFRGSHLRHTAVQNQVFPEADQAARVLGGRNGTANRDLGSSGQAGKPGSVLHFAHQAAHIAAAQIRLDGELSGFGQGKGRALRHPTHQAARAAAGCYLGDVQSQVARHHHMGVFPHLTYQTAAGATGIDFAGAGQAAGNRQGGIVAHFAYQITGSPGGLDGFLRETQVGLYGQSRALAHFAYQASGCAGGGHGKILRFLRRDLLVVL